MEELHSIENLPKTVSARAVVYSFDNSVLYIALACDKDEVWNFVYSHEGISTEEKTSVIKGVNELTTLTVLPDNIKKHFSVAGSNESDPESFFYLIETTHAPLSLVNDGTFKSIGWFTLKQIEEMKVSNPVSKIIKAGFLDIKENRYFFADHKKLLTSFFVVFFTILCGYGIFYFSVTLPQKRLTNKITKHTEAYYASLLNNSPVALQNSLVDDIKSGVNDKYTKSDAYFVTHRFFDNGGNIYEIYDYVNNHPELAFLKEAEAIYPSIFKQIKDKKLPTYYVDRGFYAYLAYVEVLYKHGYTDIAGSGTAANQYAKIAYYAEFISKKLPMKEGVARAKYVKRDTKKSLEFLKIANPDAAKIIDGKLTADDVTSRDILVGLNQYGASLRYLEALGVKATSTKTSREVFTFTMNYSYKNVPELVFFTSLLNASTLVILSSSTPTEIRSALYPILDFDVKNSKLLKTSILHKIIDSRFEKEPKDIRDLNTDLYGKTNILMLAKAVPDFKSWLMVNGWSEADFK